MATILHITARTAWEEAAASDAYVAPSLRSEGFIHCSRPDQVLGVANSRFRGQRDLVLLWIDTDRVGAAIRFENLEGGETRFPHVYGPIEVAAVREVLPFPAGADGGFELPARLTGFVG